MWVGVRLCGGLCVGAGGVVGCGGVHARAGGGAALGARAAASQRMAVEHHGSWHVMDTLRDKNHLEAVWASRRAPWKVW